MNDAITATEASAMNELSPRISRRGSFAIVSTSSSAVAALIVLGGFEGIGRVWGAVCLLGISLTLLWALARRHYLDLQVTDQAALALMICHTVLANTSRDTRILAEEQTPTVGIFAQVAIWLLCLFYAAVRLMAEPQRIRILAGPGGKYATLFLVAAAASTLYALSPIITAVWLLKLFTVVALSCVLFDRRDPDGSARRFMTATYSGLILMIVQFVVLAAIYSRDAVVQDRATGIWRAGGVLLPPTQLAGVAGLVAALALVDLLSLRPRKLPGLIFAGSFLLMMASLGRGGILAALAAILLVLTAFRRLHLAAALAVLAVIAGIAEPSLGRTSWSLATRGQDLDQIMSLTGRLDVWERSIQLIRTRPLLGWGYVSGSRVGLLLPFPWWAGADAHNAFLEVLVGLGLVGGLVLLGLLWKTISGTLRSLSRCWNAACPPVRGLISLKLLVILVSLIVQGMFEQGFSGAPRYSAVILMGACFCADMLRSPVLPDTAPVRAR